MTALINTACTVKLRPVQLFLEIFRPIFEVVQGGSNGLFNEYLPICWTKDWIYNFEETYFQKNERSKLISS